MKQIRLDQVQGGAELARVLENGVGAEAVDTAIAKPGGGAYTAAELLTLLNDVLRGAPLDGVTYRNAVKVTSTGSAAAPQEVGLWVGSAASTQPEVLKLVNGEWTPLTLGTDFDYIVADGQLTVSLRTAGDVVVAYSPQPGVRVVSLPVQAGSPVATGAEVGPEWTSLNEALLTVTGETSGTAAGTYTAVFTPRDGVRWTDGSSAARTASWTIAAPPPPTVYGMVLVQEGGQGGTWALVDGDFNTVTFDASVHGTWANMRTLTLDSGDVVVEIPTTYVKTEVLQSGPYQGCTCWWTADGPVEGLHVHPAFVKPDGSAGTLRIGAYMVSKGAGDVPMSAATADDADPGNFWTEITYNDLRAAGLTKTGGWRAYSAFDHHLLARLMLTEFGTADVQSVSGWDGGSRVTYRGVRDPFGLPNNALWCWLDGLTTEDGVWNILDPAGSGTMVVTSDSTSIGTVDGYPLSSRTGVVNGVDLGDLFIGAAFAADAASATFTDAQTLTADRALLVRWSANAGGGPFGLHATDPVGSDTRLGWRLAQVV